MRYSVVLTVGLLLQACGPGIQLSPEAVPVLLLSAGPANLLNDYAPIATVECSKGFNARGLRTNIRQCHNDLRNQTAELQGVLVVITSQALGPGDCGNCVVMVATAYRRKQ